MGLRRLGWGVGWCVIWGFQQASRSRLILAGYFFSEPMAPRSVRISLCVVPESVLVRLVGDAGRLREWVGKVWGVPAPVMGWCVVGRIVGTVGMLWVLPPSLRHAC